MLTVCTAPFETNPLNTIIKVFEGPAEVAKGWLMSPSVIVSVWPPTGLLTVTNTVVEKALVSVLHTPTVIVGVAIEQIGGVTEQEAGAVY
jgi:hypothetical protein